MSTAWGQPCKVPLRNLSYVTGSVHRDLHELLTLLCAETERRGYRIRRDWSWGFACRYIAGTGKWSTHAWGIAVDINAPTNPHRRPLTTDMPAWMPRLWESYGFTWGGRWRTPDAMHYEANGTPAQMRRHLERARRELGGQPLPTPPDEWEAFMATLSPKQREFLDAYSAEGVQSGVRGDSAYRQWLLTHRALTGAGLIGGPDDRREAYFRVLAQLAEQLWAVGSSARGLVRWGIGMIHRARQEWPDLQEASDKEQT